LKIKEIQKSIEKAQLSSFLFSSRPNIFYLAGFNSTNAYILITPSEKYFITDSRYYEGAKKKLKNWHIIQLGGGGKKQFEHLIEIINNYGGKNMGFEEDRITLAFYKRLKEGIKPNLKGFSGFLNKFRMEKTKREIAIIKTAVKKTDAVFHKILQYIPQAVDELDLRREIINGIFLEGGIGESFPVIVASGENSAIPHHETSHTPIKKNSPLLIDMGMIYEGYCSDFTRTVFVGRIDPELEKVYQIVKEAHLRAVEKVRTGVPVKEIDKIARETVKKYGYENYFTHSTGHGVGIEIHEPPRVSNQSEEILGENTVITIEPGIYLPGKGGVRLENMVIARKDECEVLTGTPLEPVII